MAPARVPARPGHRGGGRRAPGGHRGDIGRARDHGLGRDQRGVRGQLAGHHRFGPGVPGFPRRAGAVRPGDPGLRAAAGGGAAGPGRGAGPGAARPGLDRPAAGRALYRRPGRAGLPGAGKAPGAGGARHVLPGSFPAHQGPPDGGGPAALGPAGRGYGPARRAARRLPGGLPRLLRPARGHRTPRRCVAPIPRSCWFPGWACSASGPTSRPPGWPASSTPTRST